MPGFGVGAAGCVGSWLREMFGLMKASIVAVGAAAPYDIHLSPCVPVLTTVALAGAAGGAGLVGGVSIDGLI